VAQRWAHHWPFRSSTAGGAISALGVVATCAELKVREEIASDGHLRVVLGGEKELSDRVTKLL